MVLHAWFLDDGMGQGPLWKEVWAKIFNPRVETYQFLRSHDPPQTSHKQVTNPKSPPFTRGSFIGKESFFFAQIFVAPSGEQVE